MSATASASRAMARAARVAFVVGDRSHDNDLALRPCPRHVGERRRDGKERTLEVDYDEGDAIGALVWFHAPVDWLRAADCVRGILERHAQPIGGGERPQARPDPLFAAQSGLHAATPIAGDDREGEPFGPSVDDVHGAIVRAFGQPEGDHAPAAQARHRAHARIVGVQHRQAMRGYRRDQLADLVRHGVRTAKVFHVIAAYLGHDGDGERSGRSDAR